MYMTSSLKGEVEVKAEGIWEWAVHDSVVSLWLSSKEHLKWRRCVKGRGEREGGSERRGEGIEG